MSVIITRNDAEDFVNDVTKDKFTHEGYRIFEDFLFKLLETDEYEVSYNDFKKIVEECYNYEDGLKWNLYDGSSPEVYLYWMGEIEEEDDEITPEQRAEVVARFKYWINNSLGLPFNGETFNEYTIRSLVEKAKEMGKVVLFDKNGDIAGIPFFNKR